LLVKVRRNCPGERIGRGWVLSRRR